MDEVAFCRTKDSGIITIFLPILLHRMSSLIARLGTFFFERLRRDTYLHTRPEWTEMHSSVLYSSAFLLLSLELRRSARVWFLPGESSFWFAAEVALEVAVVVAEPTWLVSQEEA